MMPVATVTPTTYASSTQLPFDADLGPQLNSDNIAFCCPHAAFAKVMRISQP